MTKEIIEIMANQMGIFLKLDEAFFESRDQPIGVCMMMDTHTDFLEGINLLSNSGSSVEKLQWSRPK